MYVPSPPQACVLSAEHPNVHFFKLSAVYFKPEGGVFPHLNKSVQQKCITQNTEPLTSIASDTLFQQIHSQGLDILFDKFHCHY